MRVRIPAARVIATNKNAARNWAAFGFAVQRFVETILHKIPRISIPATGVEPAQWLKIVGHALRRLVQPPLPSYGAGIDSRLEMLWPRMS